MAKEKINIKDKVAEGGIFATLIYEMLGKPKENVDTAIKLLVEKFKKMDKVKIVEEKYFEPKTVEDSDLWSNFVELTVLVKDINTFLSLCLDYLPSSIEIRDPETLNMRGSELAGILNDLSVKLINMNVEYQKKTIENTLLKKKLNTLISVNIINALKDGEKDIKEISDVTRIREEDLSTFLSDLVKSGKLSEEEGKYTLKNG